MHNSSHHHGRGHCKSQWLPNSVSLPPNTYWTEWKKNCTSDKSKACVAATREYITHPPACAAHTCHAQRSAPPLTQARTQTARAGERTRHPHKKQTAPPPLLQSRGEGRGESGGPGGAEAVTPPSDSVNWPGELTSSPPPISPSLRPPVPGWTEAVVLPAPQAAAAAAAGGFLAELRQTFRFASEFLFRDVLWVCRLAPACFLFGVGRCGDVRIECTRLLVLDCWVPLRS